MKGDLSQQRAYKTIRNASDDPGAEALDEHMDRAEKMISAFYFLAFLSVPGILVPIKLPKVGMSLTTTALTAALICFGLSVYIVQPGGQARHPESRLSELRLPKPISTTNNESIFFTASRFEFPGRLCNSSSAAADSR